MHYDIRYDTSKGRKDVTVDAKALQDLRSYLGELRWEKIGQDIFGRSWNFASYHDRKMFVKGFRFQMAIVAGVSGRPVSAYLRAIFAHVRKGMN